MGWIWFLFLAFSLLGNILEKLMKEQNPSRPVKPGKEGNRPLPPGKPFSFPPILMEEWAEENEPPKTLPKTEPEMGPLPTEMSEPDQLADSAPEQVRMVADEREDWLFDQQEELDGKDLGVASYTDADEEEETEALDGRGIDDRLLYDALVLAHALPRPDWRTVPWRRRL
ncbi:MAG TPA: hypothetical protein GXX33_05915 [Firmicutes bacterium]|uniref:Uncharacterized protein n=1 Tax=Capillibacterium thermochitinicola TaxID=2699427 RepID=A0A8J6HZZ1_9FIRM|nr:hypothetical protein [Capillibacterium thermochitinicola]MBA2132443.1 hypothetical protein [Capillibacterium thermochitinicola]HHW12520.1 hypothetical protein [Bacillota bacterium]